MIIMTSWRRFREIRNRRAIRGRSCTMVNDAVIDEWKSDPREPHDVPDDYIPPSSNC